MYKHIFDLLFKIGFEKSDNYKEGQINLYTYKDYSTYILLGKISLYKNYDNIYTNLIDENTITDLNEIFKFELRQLKIKTLFNGN